MTGFIVILLAIAAAVIVSALLRGKQRYHDPAMGADERNIEDYGIPVRSLYTSTKVFTLHHRIEITDEYERVAYRAESKAISLHDKTKVFRADGTLVADISRKILTLREVHYVTMSDGTEFQLSNEIMHIVKDVTNILGLGWRLMGNILALNFQLYDENERLIAVVGQKLISLHDKYSVDIYQPQHEEKVVAILVALQHMIRDREAASSSSSFSSSSGN